MYSAEHSSEFWDLFRDYAQRECLPEWTSARCSADFSRVLADFIEAVDTPIGNPEYDGFADHFRGAIWNVLSTANREEKIVGFKKLTELVEPLLKRLLIVASPERWEALHEPPPDWRQPTYNPTYGDLVGPKGFDLRAKAPKAIQDASYRVREIRNKVHVAPAWSDFQLARSIVDCLLVMFWCTAQVAPAFRNRNRVESCKSYVCHIQQRWEEHLRRWILLDAAEQPSEELLELSAGELDLRWDAWGDSGDIDLPVEEAATSTYQQAQIAGEGQRLFGGRVAEEKTWGRPLRSGKVHQLFESVGRLALVAEAGAGKTTSLQHFAYRRATELLASPHVFKPLPVYIELRFYGPEGLWDLLGQALKTVPLKRGQFENSLAAGEWILLLDGLNEVRSDLLERASGELEKLIHDFPDAPLVVASRPHPLLWRLGLPVFRLDPLTDQQIDEFLRRHFERSVDCEKFSRLLRNNPRLWEWGRNPLRLWMLAQVGGKTGGELPPNRGLLFQKFVNYLLAREEAKGPQTRRDIKLDLLSELGYKSRLDNRVSFPRLYAWEVINSRANAVGYQVDSAAFVHEIVDNGLLTDQGDILAFAHEMYQEYFAALGLKARYELSPTAIEPLRGNEFWREPLVLLYGLLGSPKALFDSVVERELSLAARCVQSELAPSIERVTNVLGRLDISSLPRQSENELTEKFRTIYILGDGKTLAHWLREARQVKHIAGIPRILARAFTGEAPAVEATFSALRRLGPNARRYAEALLAPLQSREAPIPANLQEEAADLLTKKWTKYEFAPRFCLLFIWGFQLEDMVDPAPYVEKLIRQGSVTEALHWMEKFQLRKLAPTLIQACQREDQTEIILECIWRLQLENEFPPARWIEELCEKRKFTLAGNWVSQFGLEEQFARTILQGLKNACQWKTALRLLREWHERLSAGLRQQLEPELGFKTFTQHLIETEGVPAALSFLKELDLLAQFPRQILQNTIASGNWEHALLIVETLGEQNSYPVAEWLCKLVESGKLGAATEWTRRLGLRAQLGRKIVDGYIKAGQWEEALRLIEEFNLSAELTPEFLIDKLAEERRVGAAIVWGIKLGLQQAELAALLWPWKAGVQLNELKECFKRLAKISTASLLRAVHALCHADLVRSVTQALAETGLLTGVFENFLDIASQVNALDTVALYLYWLPSQWSRESPLRERKKFQELGDRFLAWCLANGYLEIALPWIGRLGSRPDQSGILELLEQRAQEEGAAKILESFHKVRWQGQKASEAVRTFVGSLITQLIDEGKFPQAGHYVRCLRLVDEMGERLVAAAVSQGRITDAIRFIRTAWAHGTLSTATLEKLLASVAPPEKAKELCSELPRLISRQYSADALELFLLFECGHVQAAIEYASSHLLPKIRKKEDTNLKAEFARLCAHLRFSQKQLIHNHAEHERIEALNRRLTSPDTAPSPEELQGINLFGYQKNSEWLFVPYYRDFRIEPGHALMQSQVVIFQLAVSTHPSSGKLVLNAVNLRPVG
ncbi:MAG: NACHT domain-containing protein [Thermoguttaceae bacterium]|nr:NACHT domain-containing protein [Thermoguttaceae bacterium]MDW8079323.1 NACHT domain-containing protein [Thermoguttaceae bacterium]